MQQLKQFIEELLFGKKMVILAAQFTRKNSMGIIQKQSLQNAVFLYAGVLLGAINKYVLFSHILGGDKMGLTDILLSTALILTQFAKLGSGSMLIRFFPYFQRHTSKQASFYFLNLVFYPLVGFILAYLGVMLFKEPFLAHFSEKSALFVTYYLYTFPLALGYTLFTSFFSFSQSNLKTVVPVAIQEVGVRLWQAAAVLLFHFEYIGFDLFLLLYALTYWATLAALVTYLVWLGRLKLAIRFDLWGTKLHRIMWRIGGVLFLARVVETLKDNLTAIQAAALIGLNGTAIYSLSGFIAMMIYVPVRAMNSIALPIVIHDMQAKNFDRLKEIYQKTAINGLVVAMLMFLLIVVNLKLLITFLPQQKFQGLDAIQPLTIFLGISRLFDVANGVNAAIVEYAKKTFQYTFYTNVLMVFVILGLNFLLMKQMGLVGAGMAAMISMLLYNSLNTFIIWKTYRIHPFTLKSLYPVLICGALLGLYYLLPFDYSSLWVALPFSALISVLYLTLTYFLNISENINAMIRGAVKKLKGVVKKG
ncbi:MAG: lipopolysaccharide biosynthesis protein [Bacteroidia bacterium]